MSLRVNEGVGCVQYKDHAYGISEKMGGLSGKILDKMVASHPLELKSNNFMAQEERLKLVNLKSIQGIHLPMRLKIEQQIVKQNSGHHFFLPSSNFSLDVLSGVHETIDFNDILNVPEFKESMVRPHDDLEIGFK